MKMGTRSTGSRRKAAWTRSRGVTAAWGSRGTVHRRMREWMWGRFGASCGPIRYLPSEQSVQLMHGARALVGHIPILPGFLGQIVRGNWGAMGSPPGLLGSGSPWAWQHRPGGRDGQAAPPARVKLQPRTEPPGCDVRHIALEINDSLYQGLRHLPNCILFYTSAARCPNVLAGSTIVPSLCCRQPGASLHTMGADLTTRVRTEEHGSAA